MTDYRRNPDPKAQLESAVRQSQKSKLEERFLAAISQATKQIPLPAREFRFHPTRKWRFDFAWTDLKLAVEIDGGSFVGGGHNRGAQQAKDYDKMNAAVSLGWRVLRFNSKHKPEEMAEQVSLVIHGLEL